MVRVFLADDDPDVRSMLAAVLRRAGHEVHEASDGTADPGHDVDVCLTDVFMPDADGLEFLTRLRARSPGLPVIVMTGDPFFRGMDVITVARQLGARDVLLKPIHPQTLADAVAAAGRRTAAVLPPLATVGSGRAQP